MIEEYSGFGGPVGSSSVENYKEEEVGIVLKATPLVVGKGSMEPARVKVKRLGSLCRGLEVKKKVHGVGL